MLQRIFYRRTIYVFLAFINMHKSLQSANYFPRSLHILLQIPKLYNPRMQSTAINP